MTVVHAVGERPAGKPHRRDTPRPFVYFDHVARSHLDLAVLLQVFSLHVYSTRKQSDLHFTVIHIGTDPKRGAVHQNIDVVGREHETALGIFGGVSISLSAEKHPPLLSGEPVGIDQPASGIDDDLRAVGKNHAPGLTTNTLLYQVPGGMFSNMLKQLKDAGKEDKLDEVLAEIPRVREDAGYPPLVTPTSQIVGTQAVFNVIMGERYKMVTKEFKGLVHGDYGKTPAPISPEFTKKILGDEQPITCRFADTLAPEMDKLKAEAAKWATQEEDVLTYAMFPQVAPKFFDKRNAKKQGEDGDHVDYTNQSHPV